MNHVKIERKEKARKWWNKIGSDIFRRNTGSAACEKQQNNMNVTNPNHEQYIGGDSGILQGKKWNELNPIEKDAVIKAHNNGK